MNYDTASCSLSDIIREEARARGIETKRESLIALGNELRKKYGAGILAQRALQRMGDVRNVGKEVVIFDSIRNPAEIKVLRDALGKDIIFIWIDAPLEIRYLRAKERGREGGGEGKGEGGSFAEFVSQDMAEAAQNKPAYESNVAACKGYADYVIINDGTVEELIQKINRIMTKVMDGKIPSLKEAIKL